MVVAMDAEVVEPLELRYSDLLLLSSPPSGASSLPSQELGRLESLSSRVMEALGPSGPGLLCVTGVPRAPAIRRALLPLARKLALLAGGDRARVLKRHGLGSDVPLKNPDRTVSSFARQLKYNRDPCLELHSSLAKHDRENNNIIEENRKHAQDAVDGDSEFSQLGDTFQDLGFCMMELGLRLARLCDSEMGSQELELSMLESCTAKGRLIHYHSNLDNTILKKESRKRAKGSGRRPPPAIHPSVPQGSRAAGIMSNPLDPGMELQNKLEGSNHLGGGDSRRTSSSSDLWQQWHYDYGIFTVLTSPMFLCSEDASSHADSKGSKGFSSCRSISHGHTCLQLLDSSATANYKVLTVKAPPESFIIQVGESAEILSEGRLRSTLHSVCRPAGLGGGVSRETFVVFLQPAWEKTFSVLPDHVVTGNGASGSELRRAGGDEDERRRWKELEEIVRAVPPLCCRLRAGMSFAEFSRETTKQYYGGGTGTQSNR